jgi:hypothetical protein
MKTCSGPSVFDERAWSSGRAAAPWSEVSLCPDYDLYNVQGSLAARALSLYGIAVVEVGGSAIV